MEITITEMLQTHPDTASAIGGASATWMSYGQLRNLSKKIGYDLRCFNLEKSDRVAIILPNGPEMACAFIALSQWVVTAPINPNYTKDEFIFYFRDLGVKAVVFNEGYFGAALPAAKELKINIIHLSKKSNVAGEFRLSGEPRNNENISCSVELLLPKPKDIAVLLHTSGTTSRPKIVPITHSNLTASARHIAQSLLLENRDRCLNIMPLFHIHGLVAAVTATLHAGAELFCTTGFDGLKFFRWLVDYKPTWYTAVPTMHQTIVGRAKNNSDILDQINLRFVRSSSASLPPRTFYALSQTFNAPVIEGYGMTEASHQISSNPLPPRLQKAGSVGVPSGPLVKIAHQSKNCFVDGIGEIVISGPNLISGYENNRDANVQNFFESDGAIWFRTGDQGKYDNDGYLWITGRLKEIINRGGEKISPREIDEVLMEHPDVIQAVTFAKPHDKLGEDVVAAIILKVGSKLKERELREFTKLHLSYFKVPSKFFFVEEIPKNATGKLQRIGLYERLFSRD